MSCASYAVGHRLHLIQAKLLVGSPWQWRRGLLRSNDGATLAVDYNGGAFGGDPGGDPGGSSVVLWHHAPLELTPGDPVRVHERWSGLAIGDVWHSVRRESGGLGPVPAARGRRQLAARVRRRRPRLRPRPRHAEGLSGRAERR